MIKFTPTHYCPVKNPNRLVKIGTCSILEVVKPLILNKKVPTMHYNSIFQQLFNFLPRHRFEDAVKNTVNRKTKQIQIYGSSGWVSGITWQCRNHCLFSKSNFAESTWIFAITRSFYALMVSWMLLVFLGRNISCIQFHHLSTFSFPMGWLCV